MTIRFLSVARRELDDAFAWYERQSAGLGYEFLDELDRVARRIRTYPDSGEIRDSHLFGDGVNSVCVKLDKRPPQARIPPMKAREPGPSLTEVRNMGSVPLFRRNMGSVPLFRHVVCTQWYMPGIVVHEEDP